MRVSRGVKKGLLTAAIAVFIVLICLLIYLAGGAKQLRPEDCALNVWYFDVGQGDCALVSCEDTNVLIDGGEAEYAPRVEQYLRTCGVEKIDCYILSHPHSDHIGVSAHVINTFPVARVMTTEFTELNMPTTKVYEDMLDAVEATGAELLCVKGGEVYDCGPLRLEILSPLTATDDYNDMSVTVRAVYQKTAFLFTGDASAAVEEQILAAGGNIGADVLKVGHHGSSTSTSEGFLKEVSPDYAVISCGAGNAYGHPHTQTLNLLNQYGAEVFRTDVNGTVHFFGNGKRLEVQTAS